jgi:predicted nucleotidyltransferase
VEGCDAVAAEVLGVDEAGALSEEQARAVLRMNTSASAMAAASMAWRRTIT